MLYFGEKPRNKQLVDHLIDSSCCNYNQRLHVQASYIFGEALEIKCSKEVPHKSKKPPSPANLGTNFFSES